MYALISDIHANLEALTAVMADIDARGVERIICLGDIVGYGPDPEACVDIVMERAEACLTGNHDYALLHGPAGFNQMAAEVIGITRRRMQPRPTADERRGVFERHRYDNATDEGPRCLVLEHTPARRWEYMQNLRETYAVKDCLYVHASPLDPIFEYVLPDTFIETWNPEHIREMLAEVPRLGFNGHTHHPVAIDSGGTCIYPPDNYSPLHLQPDTRYLINVGSVGQPRDLDTRACYLLHDEHANTIQWRRVPYDIEATVARSEKMCGEGNFCAVRLRMGR